MTQNLKLQGAGKAKQILLSAIVFLLEKKCPHLSIEAQICCSSESKERTQVRRSGHENFECRPFAQPRLTSVVDRAYGIEYFVEEYTGTLGLGVTYLCVQVLNLAFQGSWQETCG